MRKKERLGKIKTLVNNVNDNFHLFLESEAVVKEQIVALGLDKELDEVHWNYSINFVVDKKKFDCVKRNGGTITKGCGF